MKSLSELILEVDNNQNQDQNNNQDNNQNNKDKSVKVDAGTYKQWPAVNTTVKAWIKAMSGQEEAKDSFFDGGFLVPTSIQGFAGNTQAKTATLSKQLDSACKIAIAEFSNDYAFIIDGIKPYGYVSCGWSKTKGPKIDDIVKQLKQAQQTNKTDNKDNGNNDNGNSNSASM